MASPSQGNTQNLNDGRAEALHALLNSLSPGSQNEPNGGKVTADQARMLSDKIAEMLGDGGADGARRNEKGELVNEDGLPIVDINEPLTAADFAFRPDPDNAFDDPDLLPLWTLSAEEKARRKAERERILDLLEEEEERQQTRAAEASRKRWEQEMEKRREAAKEELEKLKQAREMQKKMGKALIRSVVESRDKAEQDAAAQAEQDRLADAQRPLKPKKSVSFADTEPEEISSSGGEDKGKGVDWGDVVPGRLQKVPANGWVARQTMKTHVVERQPSGLRSPGPPVRDSDDESDTDDHADDSDEEDHTYREREVEPDEEPRGVMHSSPPESVDSEDEHVADEEPSEWDDADFDTARHQREIALEYYEKRKTIGADVVSAMRAHTHGEDEWDQPDVPLEATLASAPPKPAVSRFKAERHSHPPPNPSTLASHSLGAAVLPSSSSSSLKSAVRMGKLEDGQLFGGAEGDSEDETMAEDDNARQLLDMLRKGEFTNIGPDTAAASSSVAQPPPDIVESHRAPDKTTITPETPDGAGRPKPSKVSKFKMSMFRPQVGSGLSSPDSGSAMPTPVEVVERSSPKMHPMGAITPERTLSSGHPLPPVTRSISGSSLPPPAFNPAARQMPSMIVDSPSFMPPGMSHADVPDLQSPAFHSVVLESPSFQATSGVSSAVFSPSSTVVGTPASAAPPTPIATPLSAPRTPMRSGVVERKPPATVNGGGEAASGAQGSAGKQRVSRFKAERS